MRLVNGHESDHDNHPRNEKSNAPKTKEGTNERRKEAPMMDGGERRREAMR